MVLFALVADGECVGGGVADNVSAAFESCSLAADQWADASFIYRLCHHAARSFVFFATQCNALHMLWGCAVVFRCAHCSVAEGLSFVARVATSLL